MRSPESLRSVFGLATAFTLLTLAITKQLPLTEMLSEGKWHCSPSWLMSALRVLGWMFSEQGRAIVMACIGAVAVLSLLWSHPLREVRELAITLAMLLAFLIFVVLRTEAGVDAGKCALSAITQSHSTGTTGPRGPT